MLADLGDLDAHASRSGRERRGRSDHVPLGGSKAAEVVFKGEPAEDVPSSPPLVAIEILSPDDRFAGVLTKLEEYGAWGVAHVWFVDPISRKLYVYTAGLSETSAFRLPEYGVEMAASEVFR